MVFKSSTVAVIKFMRQNGMKNKKKLSFDMKKDLKSQLQKIVTFNCGVKQIKGFPNAF